MRALRYAGLLLAALVVAVAFSVLVSGMWAHMQRSEPPREIGPGASLPSVSPPSASPPSAALPSPSAPAPSAVPPAGGLAVAPLSPLEMGPAHELPPEEPLMPGGGGPSRYYAHRSTRLSEPAAVIPPPAAVAPPAPAPAAAPGFAARRAQVETAARQQSEAARVIARVPSRMSVGTDEKAELFIQHGDGAEALALGGPGAVIDVSVPVTFQATARAEARTSNIDITPVPGIPDTQSVSSIAPTRWAWRLTPKRAGEAEILFTLTHKVTVDGKDLDVPVKYFPQKVNITIEPWMQVKAWLGDATNLVTLFTSFVLAAAGLIAAFRPKKAA